MEKGQFGPTAYGIFADAGGSWKWNAFNLNAVKTRIKSLTYGLELKSQSASPGTRVLIS
jgi:hypothetical protein